MAPAPLVNNGLTTRTWKGQSHGLDDRRGWMRSVPGAVATGSRDRDPGSWVSCDPVATAPGTDSIPSTRLGSGLRTSPLPLGEVG